MYAIGLLASFSINVGCLLLYRYFRGTAQIRDYYTSRVGTLALEVILVSCFVYLALHKPYGTGLWASVVAIILAVGIPFSRRYGPEKKEIRRSDYPMELVVAMAETEGPRHFYFRRPGEREQQGVPGSVFITFFSPRQPIPDKLSPEHFRFPLQPSGVFRSITAVLALIEEEFAGQQVYVHLGWPMSSWLDRMATGVFVVNLMRLPRQFPEMHFSIDYGPSGLAASAAQAA
jgi:hypothetical protein